MSEGPSSVALGLVQGRRLIVVGVLAAVGLAVTLLALWLGSAEPVEPLPVAVETEEPPGDDTDGADEAEAEVEELEVVPVVTYEVYLARDPFEPVRMPEPDTPDDAVDPTDPGAPTDPADPTGPGDPTDPADPGDPSAPRDPGEPRDPDAELPRTNGECVGGDEEAVCDGRVVSLVDIATENGTPVAVIQVDSTLYDVQEQQNFAEHFRLLDIDREAGRILAVYGDSHFTLAVGERSLK